MSYYYDYFIGYKDKEDGKVYPLGPFDNEGKLRYAVSNSRSFASDLHRLFYVLKDKDTSEELKKKVDYDSPIKYLPLSELPTDSFIRKGYFLIEDVELYEKTAEDIKGDPEFDGFHDYFSPTIYAAKCSNERAFGKPEKAEDVYGNDITPHSAADYMYYAYPDFCSLEYEAFMIRETVNMLLKWDGPDYQDIVILEVEG